MLPDDDDRHRAKMVLRKQAQDAEVAAKITVALGLVLRMAGHGRRCAVVQFIKGAWDTGERRLLERTDLVAWHSMDEGFTWETQKNMIASGGSLADQPWQRIPGQAPRHGISLK